MIYLTKEQLAMEPHHSVWISASAGSGKTTILTHRIISLLLSGIEPNMILCLTYTIAATNEMKQRVLALAKQIFDLKENLPDLKNLLEQILRTKPTTIQIKRSVELYHKLISTELEIMTLHGLCQRICLFAHTICKVDEPAASALMREAKHEFISQHHNSSLKKNNDEINYIASLVSTFEINKAVNDLLKMRSDLITAIAKSGGAKAAAEIMIKLLGCAKATLSFANELEIWESQLLSPLKTLLAKMQYPSNKNQLKIFEKLHFLAKIKIEPETIAQANAIVLQIHKAKKENMAEIERLLGGFIIELNSYRTINLTLALITLTNKIGERYEELRQRGETVFGYDDLVNHAVKLGLTNPEVFANFTRQQGLRHILIDEAQDTSWRQWQICEELFREYLNDQSELGNFTIFAVGDQKQSIFSFQGADPKIFNTIKQEWKKKLGAYMVELDLDRSYRSKTEILTFVDELFKKPKMKRSINYDKDLVHFSQCGDGGKVELWPVFDKTSEDDMTLARFIASKIEPKKSYLILLKKRGELYRQIEQALSDAKISFTGIDGLNPRKDILYQDLIAILNYIANPSDGLIVAELLKSQIFNYSNQDLLDGRDAKQDLMILRNLYVSSPSIYSFILRSLEFFGGKPTLYAHPTLNYFLSTAEAFHKSTKIKSIGNFLTYFKNAEVSKNSDVMKNASVILTTIHSAKGLEADVVIIADSSSQHNPASQMESHLLLDEEGLAYWPVATISNDDKENAMTKLDLAKKQVRWDESMRLFYVAMTRARSELYFTGWQPKKKSQYQSWYETAAEILPPAISVDISELSEKVDEAMTPQFFAQNHNDYAESELVQQNIEPLPIMTHENYGIIMHKILQLISSGLNLQMIIDSYYNFLPHEILNQIKISINNLLHDKTCNYFITSIHGKSEFELLVGDKILGEQYSFKIDRILINHKNRTIDIVDYKTDANPPDNVLSLKPEYRKQLLQYRMLISKIYHNYEIRCYIIWVAKAEAMELGAVTNQ